jgi:hypothetical protein
MLALDVFLSVWLKVKSQFGIQVWLTERSSSSISSSSNSHGLKERQMHEKTMNGVHDEDCWNF